MHFHYMFHSKNVFHSPSQNLRISMEQIEYIDGKCWEQLYTFRFLRMQTFGEFKRFKFRVTIFPIKIVGVNQSEDFEDMMENLLSKLV